MSKKIAVVNGLRGIAILLVVYHHLVGCRIYNKLGWSWIVDLGWIGVNLFFILSGFVLYKPYVLNDKKIETFNDILSFYKSRASRIYPLLIFSCMIILVFVSKNELYSVIQVITCTSVFSHSNFFPSFNYALWSIQLEIIFSLIFPFILLIIKKAGILRVFWGCIICSLLVRLAGVGYQFMIIEINPVKDSIFGRLDDFLAGMLICYIYYQRTFQTKHLGIISLFCLLIGLSILEFVQHKHISEYYIIIVNNLLQIGFGGSLLYALTNKNILHDILANKILQVLGMMCYSLYVWHSYFIGKFLTTNLILETSLFLISTFLFSAFTYRYIEFGYEKDWEKLFLLTEREINS